MKIIITEDQHDSIKKKLQYMVKEYGWELSSKSVGGVNNLVRLGFNNNPMEFLHLYDDMDVVRSEEKPYLILFRYERGNNIMIYNGDTVFISSEILSFLDKGFDYSKHKNRKVLEGWFYDVYNLDGRYSYLSSTDLIKIN